MPRGIKGFQKGHKPLGSRPKKKATILKEFIKSHPMAYDEMLEILYNLAMDKTDREAAQYICDRLKGRPAISIDQRLIAKIETVSAAELDEARKEARAYALEMRKEPSLIGGTIAIQRFPEAEGSYEGSGKAVPTQGITKG